MRLQIVVTCAGTMGYERNDTRSSAVWKIFEIAANFFDSLQAIKLRIQNKGKTRAKPLTGMVQCMRERVPIRTYLRQI